MLSVPFALRFLFASQPRVMNAVLRIVIRSITAFLIASAGCTRHQAQTGAVTLIQRFGGALNLNIHFHMLFLDGVYMSGQDNRLRFRPVKAPTPAQLMRLVEQISYRVGRAIAPDETEESNAARAAGFSLHAGIAARAEQRNKLERLCRYVTRPAVSTQRLSLTRQGDIRYTLKTPYRDGTTHVIFEPLDFIARLAALVPRPRVNLTRFHGIFASNSRWRAPITPAGRGKKGVAEKDRP